MTAPRPLGYWVRTVDQLIEEQFQVAAEESGLTRREWQMLNRLRIGAVPRTRCATRWRRSSTSTRASTTRCAG